jgi:hypothetical protein
MDFVYKFNISGYNRPKVAALEFKTTLCEMQLQSTKSSCNLLDLHLLFANWSYSTGPEHYFSREFRISYSRNKKFRTNSHEVRANSHFFYEFLRNRDDREMAPFGLIARSKALNFTFIFSRFFRDFFSFHFTI